MSTARKILINTVAQIIGKVAIGLIGILVLKVLTNYLGKSGYGLYKSVYEFLAIFAIVADMGLYTIGVREMSKNPEKEGMVMANIMSIRTILVVLVSIIAFAASFVVGNFQGTLAPFAVGIAGLATVFAIMTGTISTILQVKLKMEYNSLASVVGKIASVGYILLMVFLVFPGSCGTLEALKTVFMGANSCSFEVTDAAFIQLFVAGVFGNIVMYAVTHYYARRYVKIGFRFDIGFWKDVVWKALPYGIALVLNTFYFRIGSVLLLNMKGVEAVGIYGVPLTMLEAAGIVPLYFMNSILPVLSRTVQEKDEKYKTIIQFAFDFLCLGGFPLVAVALALAPETIRLISTPEYVTNWATGHYGSDLVLQILVFGLLFSFVNSLFGYILIASNKQDKMLKRNIGGAVITAGMSALLIPFFEARGAAFGNMIGEMYILAASYLLAKRYLYFELKWVRALKIFAAAAVTGVAVYLEKILLGMLLMRFFSFPETLVTLLVFLVAAGSSVVIYFGILWATKAIDKETLAMLKKS